MSISSPQCTIRRPVAVTGFGYWSGMDVRVEFRPAPVDAGIVFVRSDLGPSARVKAVAARRIEAERRTSLQCGVVQVDMVEHILAALSGLRIDNCEVWVNAQEMPGCDGSAEPFAAALLECGFCQQRSSARLLRINQTLRIGDDDCWIEAKPTDQRTLVIEFRLDYPNCASIGRQSVRVEVTPETFMRDLAPSRTFILASEAQQMLQGGKCSRVTTQDLLVFDENGPQGNALRFSDECARHKALDLLGDLALTGRRLVGEVVAYRSGHRRNAELAAQLLRRAEAPADRVAA